MFTVDILIFSSNKKMPDWFKHQQHFKDREQCLLLKPTLYIYPVLLGHPVFIRSIPPTQSPIAPSMYAKHPHPTHPHVISSLRSNVSRFVRGFGRVRALGPRRVCKYHTHTADRRAVYLCMHAAHAILNASTTRIGDPFRRNLHTTSSTQDQRTWSYCY